MGSSAFQHTDYRHIFLKKYAGALSVTGRAVKKRTGRERTGEKLFPSEKNTEFSFDFLSVLQGVTFFAGIFGIIFPVQKLTGIFPVNGSVIAGTHLCPRDREMLPGCPQEKLPGKTHHRKKGKPGTRAPCRRQETGRPGSSAESALPHQPLPGTGSRGKAHGILCLTGCRLRKKETAVIQQRITAVSLYLKKNRLNGRGSRTRRAPE